MNLLKQYIVVFPLSALEVVAPYLSPTDVTNLFSQEPQDDTLTVL